MASLTEVSVTARKVIKYGTVIMIILALTPTMLAVINKIWLALNPPPPPPPTVRYGKLPALDLRLDSGDATPEYKLETIGGGLPGGLQDQAKVYVVWINRSRLKTLDRMIGQMRKVGFSNDPIQLDERTYLFKHPTIPAETVVDIISEGFSYKHDWTLSPEIYNSFSLPISEDNAVKDAIAFLQRITEVPTDIQAGPNRVQYMVATGSAMVPTEARGEANFVRVDLYRAEKDKLKFVTTGGDTSPVNVIISGLPDVRRTAQANYHYSQVVDNDFSTYPLKNVDTAWQELVAGKAYIAKRALPKVTIRKVYLAYYESTLPQQFLQPVYVFEGDGGFMAYVPAITSEYLTTAN